MAKQSTANVAKQSKNVTLKKDDGKKQMKPYCEEAKILAEQKRKVDELKHAASAWLQHKLENDPDTKNFSGTVLCVYDGILYKIRVQRRKSCNWKTKKLTDPRHKKLLALYREQEVLNTDIDQLESELTEAHPKCINTDFIMSFLSK